MEYMTSDEWKLPGWYGRNLVSLVGVWLKGHKGAQADRDFEEAREHGLGCVATADRTLQRLNICLVECGLANKYKGVRIQIGGEKGAHFHNVVGLQPLGQDVRPIRIFDAWLDPSHPTFNTDDWLKRQEPGQVENTTQGDHGGVIGWKW